MVAAEGIRTEWRRSERDGIVGFSIGEEHYLLDGNTCLSMAMNEETLRAVCRDLDAGAGPQALRETLGVADDPALSRLFVPAPRNHTAPPPGPTTSLCLVTAQGCNLKCPYCFAAPALESRTTMMSPQTARAAADFLVRASGPEPELGITFFGGEPLLNLRTLEQTVGYCRQHESAWGKRFRFHLTTNGTLLSPAIEALLVEQGFSVIVSLGGPPAKQNTMRPFANGRGSYDTVVDHARRLSALYPCDGITVGDLTLRTTFTARDLDLAGDFMHLTGLGFRQISIEPAVVDPMSDLCLKPAHGPEIGRQYEKLARQWQSMANAGHPVVLFTFRKLMECVTDPTWHMRQCGAANEYLGVAADGSLYPCHKTTGHSLASSCSSA